MNITQEFETIAAISTPIGTGGVGVIRISGDKSFEIAKKITDKNIQESSKQVVGVIKAIEEIASQTNLLSL